jgi:hypothetical protein
VSRLGGEEAESRQVRYAEAAAITFSVSRLEFDEGNEEERNDCPRV